MGFSRATLTVVVLAAAALAAPAQAPRKARPATASRPPVEHFSGAVVQVRGKGLPEAGSTLTAFFAKSGEVTKRFVVRFADESGASRTKVTRTGVALTPAEALDALNLEGMHVEVDYDPQPYRDTEAFLASNLEIGEIEMPSDSPSIPADLLIEDIVVGDGATAEPGRTVSVHYTGWLRDGKKFDSSHDRNQPFQFRLGGGQVIRGWDLGVAGMKVGGKRRLIIPPDLGYGARGAGGVIPPNAVLVFEVELLGVR